VLRRGSVIWARIPDPHGNVIVDDTGKPKCRPALVLSNSEDIATGDSIVVAAISTQFDLQNLPPHWFIMESHPQGHPSTGLNRPCVVKSDWLVSVRQCDIESVSPGISARNTKLVLNWLKQNPGNT
jgi:hypothetical protein